MFYQVLFLIVLNFSLHSVQAISCGDPGILPNGTRTFTSFDTAGIVRFKCDKCFTMSGSSVIQCSRWGYWSGSVPKCIQNSCPAFEVTKEFILKGESGFTYNFKCFPGQKLIGDKTMKCQCNGRWKGKPPICQQQMSTQKPTIATITTKTNNRLCTVPSSVINGFTFHVKQFLGNFRPGDLVYYLCKTRYRLVGPTYRVCQPNKKWSSHHPSCILHSCIKPFPPIDGSVSGSNRIGGVLEFACNRRFRLSGPQNITCHRNGKWSKRPPECISACKDFECPAGKNCKYDDATLEPACVCMNNLDCPAVYKPICASDSRTYNNECVMFATACRAKQNKFKVVDGLCKPGAVCHILPKGKCKARISIFYFNTRTHSCEAHSVGGCHGSGWNGYTTMKECEKDCKGICSVKADPGPCRSPSLRWAYHKDLNDCRRFVYGGCFGNRNSFPTYKKCREFCAHKAVIAFRQ